VDILSKKMAETNFPKLQKSFRKVEFKKKDFFIGK